MDWHDCYKGIYADGATVITRYSDEGDIELRLARDHATPDQSYVMTRYQANEIIYALSKAVLEHGDKRDWEQTYD